MHIPSVSRSFGPRRAIASVVVAALAFTSCGLTTGETAIEAADTPSAEVVPATQPTAAPTTAPVTAPTITEAETTTESETEDTTRGERTTSEAAPAPAEDDTADDVVAVPENPVEVEEPATEIEGETEADTDSTDAAEETTTETATFNQVDVAGCMDGVWASQPGQVGAYMARMSELTGASMDAAGRITVALENGRYVYDASITTTIDVDGFQTLSVVEGITQGDFTYTNGFIVAEQTFADIEAFVELPDGTRIDAGALGEEFNQMAAFHEVPFDCAGGDTITLHFDTLPGTARFPMTFERQP